MFRIKICGITSTEDALLAAEAGADAIGLNFYAQSPRHVAAEQASEIVERLREDHSPDEFKVVLVFVNHSVEEILWTIREADLYGPGLCLQLHGDEPPEFIRELQSHGLGASGHLLQATGHVPTVPVIRAFRLAGADVSPLRSYLSECQALSASPQAALVDAHQQGIYGGSGQRADWSALQSWNNEFGLPLILAGGLTRENVAEAIAAVRPAAVDVASGVESSPGKKDYAKTMAFIASAKQAFNAPHSPE
jgi:phosphoribosylanthranilate isomerase